MDNWSRADKFTLSAQVITVVGLLSGIFGKEIHDLFLAPGSSSSAFRLLAFVVAIAGAALVVGTLLSRRRVAGQAHSLWVVLAFVTVIAISVAGIWVMKKEKSLLPAETELGLLHIEYGKYKDDENRRLEDAIRNAHTIKLLMPNASHFSQEFRPQLEEFFSKPDSSMQVIFATPNSTFYDEMTQMTFDKPWTPNSAATKDNQNLVEFSKKRRLDDTKDEGKIEFRYFDTQFRLPMIIIDNNACYLTLRLPPNEGEESPRLEFQGGYANSCVRHFNRLWDIQR